MSNFYGPAAVAAALNIAEPALREAVRKGLILPPDDIVDGQLVWELRTLSAEIKKRLPTADGIARTILAISALNRAEAVSDGEDPAVALTKYLAESSTNKAKG